MEAMATNAASRSGRFQGPACCSFLCPTHSDRARQSANIPRDAIRHRVHLARRIVPTNCSDKLFFLNLGVEIKGPAFYEMNLGIRPSPDQYRIHLILSFLGLPLSLAVLRMHRV